MAELNIALFNTGVETKKDEAALCQLGAAVVLAWKKLSPSLQEELLSLAEQIAGVSTTPVAAGHILGLVERNA